MSYFVGRPIISDVSNKCENMNELVSKYKKTLKVDASLCNIYSLLKLKLVTYMLLSVLINKICYI